MLLQGKKLLVTGGSLGIGRAIVLEAARQGADVGFHYYNSDEAAREVIAQVEKLGRKVYAQSGDVADPEQAKSFVAGATAALGGVDAFVSNAGICPFHGFLDMPVATVRRTVEVNLLGGFFMCQAAANQMVAQGNGGSITAISSISALVGGEMQTHYTPTKAGLHSLMQSAAIALGRYHIRCNSLLPGTILTDINKEDLADEAKRARMAARVPLGRLGQPEDLAGPAIFLASDLARYVTGAALLVDGGAFVNLQ